MNQVLKWLQRWILVPLWFSSQYLSFVLFFFLLYKDNILWGYINFPVCIFVSTTTYARLLQTASHIIDTHTQTNQCYTSQESPSSQAVTRRPVGRRLLKDIFLTQLLRDLEGQKSSLLKPAPVNQQVYWCWLICGAAGKTQGCQSSTEPSCRLTHALTRPTNVTDEKTLFQVF